MSWTFYNSSGEALVQHAESEASQAEMKAETAVAKFVPPDLIRHSPGVAKHYVRFDPTDTGTLIHSYNTASVTDSNVGNWTVLVDDDFSSGAKSVIVGQAQYTSGAMMGIELDGAPANSEYYVGCIDDADTRIDPLFVHLVAFGDH